MKMESLSSCLQKLAMLHWPILSITILSRIIWVCLLYTSDPKNAISLYLKSKGGFVPSVTNLNTPDVGYSCVIEEAFDKDNKSQCYIVRHYSNYNEDIYGNTHYDELAFY